MTQELGRYGGFTALKGTAMRQAEIDETHHDDAQQHSGQMTAAIRNSSARMC